MRKLSALIVLLAVAVLLSTTLLADTLTLKDGTVVEGRVIQQGDKYWVKLADGQTKVVAKADVVKYVKASATPAAQATPAAPVAPAVKSAGATSTPAADSSAPLTFAQTKSKADRADVPLVAV